MYRTAWVFCLAALLGVCAGRAAAQEKSRLPDALVLQEAMVEAIKKAEPSIACVLVSRSDDVRNQALDDPDHVPESYGSGVVVDTKGLILTNLHVVRDATAIYIRLPGERGSRAIVHAGDPRSDLAVLRLLDPTILPIKPLKFGDADKVRKGDLVLSLANPFAAGFHDGSPSASWGILSNVRRRAPGKLNEEANYRVLHQYGTLFQTDARLNLGCSGGALVNLQGELIGLTTALAAINGSETPGGFAVPMDAGMRRIIDVLKRGDEVEYGFLGVSFPPKERRIPLGDAVQVGQVISGSPASFAGLRIGDYIRSVNGMRVRDPDDLFLSLGTLLAGSVAKLEIAHSPKGPSEFLSVTLAKFYVPGKIIATHRPEAIGGLRVDWTSILFLRPGGQQIYARGIPDGVMIREVLTGSAADTARLQESKIIQKVNNHRVTNPEEFYREVRNAAGSVELTLMPSDPREEVKVKIDLK